MCSFKTDKKTICTKQHTQLSHFLTVKLFSSNMFPIQTKKKKSTASCLIGFESATSRLLNIFSPDRKFLQKQTITPIKPITHTQRGEVRGFTDSVTVHILVSTSPPPADKNIQTSHLCVLQVSVSTFSPLNFLYLLEELNLLLVLHL